ncbi:MAG: hypothetical protein EHM49_01365 [Deltaproteobacteria bacterium]|nr:MAG: hypothetical protein EHM49_01365 [Deltaproteobacteria bacterium]
MGVFSFRKAVREELGLLIGLIGPSGGGKTYTAMRIAAGIVGKENRFAVIDTEAGRAKHYAEIFNFDHGDLKPPFRPNTYAEAIRVADEAGYKAIIVDSFSHEWAGEGGILDWQEEELTRMAGNDYQKREACKMASWVKPKMGHKQMVQRLLQVRATLILCFRADDKVAMEKNEQGKLVVVSKGWQPICSKEMPYELTVSFLLTPDRPGVPQPIKLQLQHGELFPPDQQITEESGRLISKWAAGGKAKRHGPEEQPPIEQVAAPSPPFSPPPPPKSGIVGQPTTTIPDYLPPLSMGNGPTGKDRKRTDPRLLEKIKCPSTGGMVRRQDCQNMCKIRRGCKAWEGEI